MKKHIYLCLLLVFVSFTNINAQNLVGYYKLDGSAYAFIGNANGTTTGSVSADSNRFNLQNSSLRFMNFSSYATIPSSFDLAERTLNLWINIDTILSSTPANILTIDNSTLNHGMIYLQVTRTLGISKLQFFGGNVNPVELNVVTKKWYKLTITYKNSTYKLYVDNILKGTVTSTNVHSADGYQGLVLGSNRALNHIVTFRGRLDDLSIYNYAMDSSQIANITEATCNFNNIINVYDTTTVTVVDTNFINITDTTYLTVVDTNYVTITDTNTVTIIDTIYLSVYDTLIVDIFSSISQSPINTIKVFPNPTKDFLNINNGNFSVINNYQYIIINSIGQSVFTHVVNSANTLINISAWPEGIYFLNIYDATSKLVEVKKIIIN